MRSRLSIKMRLILGVALSLLLMFAVLIYLVRQKALMEAQELLEGNLVGTSRVAVQIANSAPFSLAPAPALLARDLYESPLVVQFWSRHGELLSQIGTLAGADTPPPKSGFDKHLIDGRPWRSYAALNQSGLVWVRTLLPHDAGTLMVTDVTYHFAKVALIAAVVLIGSIWIFMWYLLRPLSVFSAVLSKTPINRIGAVDMQPRAGELRAVVDALNDVMGRVKDERELERAFIADAAHELRTPLAGIQLHAQNAQREDDPERLRRALQYVEDGCRRATHIVSQLLGLAQYDAVRRLPMVPVCAESLVRRVLPFVLPSADQRNVEVVSDLDANTTMLGDEAALDVVLRNLLLNAIQFSPDGGVVRIEVRDLGKYVTLAVQDRGPGVPREARREIFERFARLPDSRPGGSGLGLAIVRRILSLHRAQIHVNNQAGGGAAFTVRLRNASSRGPQSLLHSRLGR